MVTLAHIDLQQVIAFGIVAVAFWAVGRRLWNQILAFRSRPARRKGTRKPTAAPSDTPLIQVQLKPPAHLKRPPSER